MKKTRKRTRGRSEASFLRGAALRAAPRLRAGADWPDRSARGAGAVGLDRPLQEDREEDYEHYLGRELRERHTRGSQRCGDPGQEEYEETER